MMGLRHGRQRLLELEQPAAELTAQQTELQDALCQGRRGPIDDHAVQTDLAGVRAERMKTLPTQPGGVGECGGSRRQPSQGGA